MNNILHLFIQNITLVMENNQIGGSKTMNTFYFLMNILYSVFQYIRTYYTCSYFYYFHIILAHYRNFIFT